MTGYLKDEKGRFTKPSKLQYEGVNFWTSSGVNDPDGRRGHLAAYIDEYTIKCGGEWGLGWTWLNAVESEKLNGEEKE